MYWALKFKWAFHRQEGEGIPGKGDHGKRKLGAMRMHQIPETKECDQKKKKKYVGPVRINKTKKAD